MKFIHCPYCGKKLVQKSIGDEGLMSFCNFCDRPIFDMSYTCTITLVTNELGEVALIKQGYVSQTNYVLIAGYMKSGESAELTAFREVEEEIGLRPTSLQYIKSYFYEKRDMLMMGFVANADKKEFQISGEVDAAEWFTIEEALTKLKEGSIAMQLLLDYISSL